MLNRLLKSDRWKSMLEFLAIVAPIICLIDCIILPLVAILLPFVSFGQFMHGLSDQAIGLAVITICMAAIVPGFLKHRSKRVLVLFSSGVTLMFFVSFLGEQLDHFVHAAMTVCVSFLLIKANMENKKLLSCGCGHHHKHEKKDLVASGHSV